MKDFNHWLTDLTNETRAKEAAEKSIPEATKPEEKITGYESDFMILDEAGSIPNDWFVAKDSDDTAIKVYTIDSCTSKRAKQRD